MAATGGSDQIDIDPAALDRASRDLTEAGGRIGDAATTAGSVEVSASAFGTMNSYLGTPIAQAASTTTDMLRITGDVVSTLGVSAKAAADDWRAYEEGLGETLSKAATDIEAAREIL